MAWSENKSRKLARRLADESRATYKLIKDYEKKSPAYVSKMLGHEVALNLVQANIEIKSEIGDGAQRTDLGFKEKVLRKQAIQDTAYFLKQEIKAQGINTRLMDNRAAQKGVNEMIKVQKQGDPYADEVTFDRIRDLSLNLHDMQNSDRKLTDVEMQLSGLYVRVPGFTRKDGTKVKSHIRKLK